MRLTFLGTGQMGSAIASILLQSGHDLTVWNRTPDRLAPLVARGAKASPTAAAAVQSSDIVFSMLMHDAAVEEVFFGPEGALEAIPENALHISLSTISVELSRRLTEEHSTRKQRFVAAPVFGRPNIAAEGKLWIVAAGRPEALEMASPLLSSFSRGLTVVGDEPYKAHAMKIGGNFLITAMIASLSEGLAFAEGQGIDPELYAEVVNSALFQSPFYAAYAKLMLHPPQIPGATIALGEKDMRLFHQAAASAETSVPLAERFLEQFRQASEAGFREQDWAAGFYQFVRNTSQKSTKNA